MTILSSGKSKLSENKECNTEDFEKISDKLNKQAWARLIQKVYLSDHLKHKWLGELIQWYVSNVAVR